ncbi:MAG: LEA type 2 family protein [Ferruginibacter sp.]
MSKSFFRISVLCFLILLVVGCSAPKDLVFKEYKNLKIDKLGFSNANLSLDLVYYNPNNFGLELNRTDLDIYIDSNLLGHSSQVIQIAIPKRDVFTIPLKVDLDMKNLLKNGLTTLFNKEVKVRILGKVKVGKAGVYKSINVDYETTQNLSLFN